MAGFYHSDLARLVNNGATSPAEFFAVLSEYFFTTPRPLLHDCPNVYKQLKHFYRQDSLTHMPSV